MLVFAGLFTGGWCGGIEFVMVEHLSTRERTAKKEHSCVWCPEKIEPGFRYKSHCIKFDGEFQFNLYHVECFRAMSTADRDMCLEDGFMPHEFKRGTTKEAR